MGLYEDLRNLAEQIKKRQAHVKGEEATKQALVLPFLQVLGFDIYDPTEVKPEYIADFAKKKSSGQFEKIDYAITLKGEPAIFVECKAVDVAVEDHDGQLARYFNSTPVVKLGVLTNGLKYRFFTDRDKEHIMDAAPFLEFNILSFTEREAEQLRRFTKELFDAGAIRKHAEEIIALDKITGLMSELLRNPSESFIRFVLKAQGLGGNMVTEKVVKEYEPIVKKSIQAALLELMTKSLQQEIEPLATPLSSSLVQSTSHPQGAEKTSASVAPEGSVKTPGSVKPSGTATIMPDGTTAPGAETTEEELEIFAVLKGICGNTSLAPIKYRDGTNYFSINLGPLNSWFLRLFIGTHTKSFIARLPLSQVTPLATGFKVEAVKDNPDKTRIYFSSVSDVERLRALILKLYEEAVRRQQLGDGEDGAD